MKKLGLCVVGATVAVVIPMSVEATDLETITVVGSRTERPLKEIAATIADCNAVVSVTASLPCPDSLGLPDMLFEPTSCSRCTSIASLWVVFDSGTEGRSGGSRSLQ